jgi:hypothetical protein
LRVRLAPMPWLAKFSLPADLPRGRWAIADAGYHCTPSVAAEGARLSSAGVAGDNA